MNWLDEILDGDEPCSVGDLSLIESLLQRSCLTSREKEEIEAEMNNYSKLEALEKINYLHLKQLDPFEYGLNFTQTDILNKLNKLK